MREHCVSLRGVGDSPTKLVGQILEHVWPKNRAEDLARIGAKQGNTGGTADRVVHEEVTVTLQRVPSNL